MLIDYQYSSKRGQLIVSYVDESGEIKLKWIDWKNPTKFETCSSDDPDRHPVYKSWDKKAVKKVEVSSPDRYAVYEFLDSLPQDLQNEIFDYHEPKIFFVDIETEIVDGFPEAETALTQVLSISVVYDDKIILMGLRDMPEDMQERIRVNTNKYFETLHVDYKFKYIKYDDEFDMLYQFFEKMVPKMPVITGWNFTDYDWKYLINRSRKIKKVVNGKEYSIDVSKSSPTRKMWKPWMTSYEFPSHRMIIDYMQLYKCCDTSIKVKESASLDYVSDKLIGINKIKYTGSLQRLYEDDFETFMYYNAVDSVLVQMIHLKMNYISIIYGISSLSKIKIVDVINNTNDSLASLAITEGVLRNRFREMENIVLFKDGKNDGTDTIEGGWVKDPIVGMNKWICCYDFASLYPTTQRQFFIAPETFVGILVNRDSGITDTGVRVNLDLHVVCVNGAVFEKRRSPTIRMLEDVYADRKKNKKLMMERKEELAELKNKIKELEAELSE
jgi:DNA polymerase elongation subunit (family B)